MNLGRIVKGLSRTVERHSPEILTGIGIAGFITAVVLAVKATPKAEELIVEAEDEKEDVLTPIETVKAAWKPYVPAAITIVASTACVVGAAKINNRRNTELATAYAISQAMVKRYQDKTREIAGEEKAKEIDTAVKQETAKSPMVQEAVKTLPKSSSMGMQPWIDTMSNTPFYATTLMIKDAEVSLNQRLYTASEPYVTVNDLYDELNEKGVYPPLKHTSIGNMLGWYPENGGIAFHMDVDGVPLELDRWEDGTPCYVMSFKYGHQPETLE
ncbi:MAG: hypothetical protein J6U54_08000 [Clostridiales bacterium]|nr:hypothetical protein [Clostridiales bacterium]